MKPVSYPPGEALLAAYRRRGPVINAGIGSRGFVYLLGPEANKFVFANADAFSWRETFETLAPVDGPTALIVSDGDDHRRRRSVVAPGLRHRQVQEYVQTMVRSVDTMIDDWRPGQRVDIYQGFRSAIRRSTAESLFGSRMAAHSDFLGAQLQPLLDLTHHLPQVMAMQRRLNSPGWRRAMTARARIDELMDTEIADARARPRPDDHMLTTLLNGRSDEGQTLSDNEIRDQIVSMITAGFETTSGALAWAAHLLLTIPGAWDTAAAELGRVLGGAPPAAADLPALTYLNGVVHETLRLYPPGVISARRVMRDLRFEGRHIPAGRMIVFSAYVTHRLPEIWPEPTQFRPQRWDPDAPDYRKPAPYEFIPFSGGLHRCIGSVMAITEMTVMLARLVARTTLDLPAQRLRAANFASLSPKPGLTVHVRESVPAQ
ncbi:cytochrome P450 [Mycobacterium paragordonae]|uniref:Cytochrome P450 n=1 Tax=Mycobacterium paragordonae TaxID=1389713 RepID=A0A4R5WE25_9MYCO|nr:cytochrome P450 [Mycobacterium paragordonae]MDP7735185.1 cytochrome P450 [Mycobacterium paragordonae]TDK88103.1 cytochrome P450 [Mycobacterium paragordonae]TDK95890.1 cytochrome P450 [Mycobacterium paragordonae]TDL02109.1 cytochrome P450 [Mycobacterium paragordonae]